MRCWEPSECDLLVEAGARPRTDRLLRRPKSRQAAAAGTVAVLADETPAVDKAIAEIMAVYQKQTHITPEAFTGTSPGAWHVGTVVIGG